MKNLRKIAALLIVLISCVSSAMAFDTWKITLTKVNVSKKAEIIKALEDCKMTSSAARTAFDKVKNGGTYVVSKNASDLDASLFCAYISNAGGQATREKNTGTLYKVTLTKVGKESYNKQAIVLVLQNNGFSKTEATNIYNEVKSGKTRVIFRKATQQTADNFKSNMRYANGDALIEEEK